MEVTMRRLAAVPILALMLAACANEPVAPRSGDPEPTLDETRLAIYEALTREVVGAEGPGFDWKRIVIVSKLCENAGQPDQPEGCTDELSADEQAELASRIEGLAPKIEFMADPTPLYDEDGWLSGQSQTLVVRLGTIADHGDGVAVGGSHGCGGLCGGGTTYVLEEKASGWEVVGTTGSMWIS
jgi:hypothetical protein